VGLQVSSLTSELLLKSSFHHDLTFFLVMLSLSKKMHDHHGAVNVKTMPLDFQNCELSKRFSL
jgi:hypothetical protein